MPLSPKRAGRSGDYPKLSELEVGIVGVGPIGRMVAVYWKSLGAQYCSVDPGCLGGGEGTVDHDVATRHVGRLV